MVGAGRRDVHGSVQTLLKQEVGPQGTRFGSTEFISQSLRILTDPITFMVKRVV